MPSMSLMKKMGLTGMMTEIFDVLGFVAVLAITIVILWIGSK